MIRCNDPLELIVAEALDKAGIDYTHDSSGKHGLDFYLPSFDVYIECKALYTDRVNKQIEGKKVIVIQTIEAARAFAAMIT